MMIDLNFRKAGLFQGCIDFICRVAAHPVNDLLVLQTRFICAIRFIYDQESAAWF